MNNGFLQYNINDDRYYIANQDGERQIDLHCGDCFNIEVNNKFIETRIEMSQDWYLIDIKKTIDELIGARVQYA